MIHVEGLTVSFNGFRAVDNISFDVKPGEVVGILGANGAGKSTTMKSLAGIIRPQEGFIKVAEHILTNVKEEEAAKMLLGYCPDVGGLVVGATPREHIQLLLSLHDRPEDYDTGLFLVEKIGLQEFIDTPVGGFSHGMSRRLSVVLATLASSKVLILDEPFDGVDPVGVDAIEMIIQEAKNAGLAVIVSTHLQHVLTRVTDRVIVMRKGVILAKMDSSSLEGEEGEVLYKQMLSTADTNEKDYEDIILENNFSENLARRKMLETESLVEEVSVAIDDVEIIEVVGTIEITKDATTDSNAIETEDLSSSPDEVKQPVEALTEVTEIHSESSGNVSDVIVDASDESVGSK